MWTALLLGRLRADPCVNLPDAAGMSRECTDGRAARVRITTTVEEDGSVRLLESQIEPAGIQGGDRVRIEIVKEGEKADPVPPSRTITPGPSIVLNADELAALPFDEWLKRFRADFPVDPGVAVEDLIREAAEAAVDEF